MITTGTTMITDVVDSSPVGRCALLLTGEVAIELASVTGQVAIELASVVSDMAVPPSL